MSVREVPTRNANTKTTKDPSHLSNMNILSNVSIGEKSRAMETIMSIQETSLMSMVNLELFFLCISKILSLERSPS